MKQHIVITGASRGIGLELTRQSLKAGNIVSAWIRNPEKAGALQSLKRDYPETLHLYEVDVLSDAAVESAAQQMVHTHQIVDILINNAGTYLDGDDTFESLDIQKVTDSLEMNSVSPVRVTQALLSLLQKSKNPKLVNISSLMGSIDDNKGGGSYAYRMSKAALNMFTKSFSVDFPEISSIVIHPGWVQTDMGGKNATLSVEESAKGILNVVSNLTPKGTGKFFDYEGDALAW